MSKILVLPDIHNRIATAQRLIDTVPHDKCILLGDYFDDFGDTPKDVYNTAVWLKESIVDNPKIVKLFGNHDQSYLFPCRPDFQCSGFTPEKQRAIYSVLNRDDVDKFKFHHVEDGWVFSHAGLRVSHWKDMIQYEEPHDPTKEPLLVYFDRVMNRWIEKTINNIYTINPVPLIAVGWDRGGRQHFGGITWCDFRNLVSIKGINQIVGHTPHKVPQVHAIDGGGGYTVKSIFEFLSIKRDWVSINYDLDTHSNHYAVITDGVVEIWDTTLNEPLTNTKHKLNGPRDLNVGKNKQNEK